MWLLRVFGFQLWHLTISSATMATAASLQPTSSPTISLLAARYIITNTWGFTLRSLIDRCFPGHSVFLQPPDYRPAAVARALPPARQPARAVNFPAHMLRLQHVTRCHSLCLFFSSDTPRTCICCIPAQRQRILKICNRHLCFVVVTFRVAATVSSQRNPDVGLSLPPANKK